MPTYRSDSKNYNKKLTHIHTDKHIHARILPIQYISDGLTESWSIDKNVERAVFTHQMIIERHGSRKE